MNDHPTALGFLYFVNMTCYQTTHDIGYTSTICNSYNYNICHLYPLCFAEYRDWICAYLTIIAF